MVSAAALFVALAIAPGLLFIAMAARRMRVARDLGNAPLTLSFGASASLFVHLVAAALVWMCLRILEGQPYLLPAAETAPGRLAASLGVLVVGAAGTGPSLADFVNAMLYAFLATALGAGLGYGFGALVMRGRIETDFFHGALYPYVREDAARFVFASVLSRTEIDGRRLLYDGFLADIRWHADGTVAGIALIAPTRSLMVATGGPGAAGPLGIAREGEVQIGNETGDVANTLFVDGDDIANYVLYDFEVDK